MSPPGTYTLGVKGSKWLRKNQAVSTVGGSVSGLTVPLLCGDADGDNQVNASDFSDPAKSLWVQTGRC